MEITGKDLWVLLCDCSKYGDKDALICGVYGSKEEAKAGEKEVGGCPAKHIIRRCKKVVVVV